jgi:hypothetical protein
LAEAHASLNDRATQLQLLQRALLIQETVFGPDHEEVRLTLEELADAYGRCESDMQGARQRGLCFIILFYFIVIFNSFYFSSGDVAQQQKCKQRADAILALQEVGK